MEILGARSDLVVTSLEMPNIMAQYPKAESIGSIAPKQWTLYCLYSLSLVMLGIYTSTKPLYFYQGPCGLFLIVFGKSYRILGTH